MELFFIAFQLLIEVQSYNSLQRPFISVSDDGDQINIACETPLSVRADFTCSLYIEDGLLHSQKRQSGERLCMFYVAPGELLTRSENRQLSCDYSLNTEPEIRSPRSETYTIRVTSSAKALTTAIKTSSTATSTGETLTDKTSVFTPASAPETTRETQTSAPHSDHIHSEVSWLSVVLVFTGVGLFLSGLMGFICLCHFDSSDDVLTEVNYSSCQVETTSLLTSSVCSKKHG
ncbi:uncharacterized protein LOC127523053 [Ctenopharyngodon idella]|uniref:uncharacterized protein LOC127523053 n=1 Tax=Ctenopharyngodon idella TaxID=7959 RepID=UPI002231E3A4|nr:uncharacterized protein LOC127523053 [Ctenopharyngodon idella]